MRIALITAILLSLHGCAGMTVEPADDQWDRPQEAMPGVISGDKGVFTFSATSRHGDAAGDEHPDGAEFHQWQAWHKARRERTEDYIEFLQWLDFQKARRDSTAVTHPKP